MNSCSRLLKQLKNLLSVGFFNDKIVILWFQGLDGEGQPLVSLYFRVQFYVDQIVLLRY